MTWRGRRIRCMWIPCRSFRVRQSRPCPRCCTPCVSLGCCSPLARAARCRRAQAGAGKDPKQAGHGMWIPPYSVRLDVACPKLAALVWLRYRVVRETCRVLGWQAGTLWVRTVRAGRPANLDRFAICCVLTRSPVTACQGRPSHTP